MNLPPPGTLLLRGLGPATRRPRCCRGWGAEHRPEPGGQHPPQCTTSGAVGPCLEAARALQLLRDLPLPKSRPPLSGKGMQTGANSAQTLTAVPPSLAELRHPRPLCTEAAGAAFERGACSAQLCCAGTARWHLQPPLCSSSPPGHPHGPPRAVLCRRSRILWHRRIALIPPDLSGQKAPVLPRAAAFSCLHAVLLAPGLHFQRQLEQPEL